MAYGKPHTQLCYHMLWATYDRLPLIHPSDEPRLYQAIWAKACELKCDPIAIGSIEDHIHCVCRLPPTMALSHFVQQVKGTSSHLMTHEVGERESFRWQGCYAAFTIQKNAVPAVRAYVLNQKRHHAENTVWPEWERIEAEDEE